MIVDDFQKLIDSNIKSVSDDVYGLFCDSIKCFRSSIYRPAYILAYQGVMQHFRYLLLHSPKPDLYNQKKWEGVQRKLKDDKTFDTEIFECTQHKSQPNANPPVVAELDMPDEIRLDFVYWRNRRNDCAHYKSYEINNSHVLAFYSFLNQYLMRITVEGGMNSLLREFKDACDETKTSPNTSLQPLIDKILCMVAPDQMNVFFDQLCGVTDMFRCPGGKYYKILKDILVSSNIELKDYVIKYLRSVSFLSDFIFDNSDMVGVLIEKEEAREFWMTKLSYSYNRFTVMAKMLSCGLIPKGDIEQALTKMVDNSYINNQGFGEVSDNDWQILEQNGILDVLESKYYNVNYTTRNACVCGKDKYNFFYGTIDRIPIDKKWVKNIIEIFSAVDFPQVWCKIFNENYMCNAVYKEKFIKICKENGYTIPSCININN